MKIEKTFKSETSHIVRNAVSERCAHSEHGHSYEYQVVIEYFKFLDHFIVILNSI